jgi:Phage integrase, N-terminal SAM-like domain
MKLVLARPIATPPGACPYRVVDDRGHELAWVNDFLDAQHIRRLSPRSLRAYAYDLLHFARWFHPRSGTLSAITESTLLEYVRHQLNQQPQPTPQTVNHRLTVIRCLYRFHRGQEIPAGNSHFQRTYTARCPLGYWPPPSNDCLWSSPQATSARCPAPVCRSSRYLLGELSYVP